MLDGASRAFALHCDPSVPAGKIGLRTGAITAACDRIDVTLLGPGGHTARPQLTVDLVDALGRLITDVPGAAVPPGRPAGRDVAGLGRGQRRYRGQRDPAARSAPRHGAGARPGRLAGRRGPDAVAGRAGGRHHRRRGRRRLRARRAAGGQRPAGGRADAGRRAGDRRQRPRRRCRRRAWAGRTSAGSPTSCRSPWPGWARTAAAPPLDLHRGTFDVDERAIGIGVRLLARTALHALEADAGTPPAPPHPPHAAPGARRHFCPTSQSTRGGNPTMSPPDQQTAPLSTATGATGTADARGPGRARGPRRAGAGRGVRRRHPRPVARAGRRRAAQGRPRGPARPGRGRAARAGRHRRHASPRCTPPTTPATCRRRSASRACRRSSAARAAGARPERGVPGGWDIRQRHAHPDVATTKEAIAADLENGVTSLWLVLGDGAIPVDALGDVLADVLLDLAPVSLSGRPAGRRGVPLAGRGPHRPRARAARWASTRSGCTPRAVTAQDLSGLADVARRAAAHHGLRTVVVDAHRLRRRRGLGGRGARLLAGGRGRLPAGAHRGRAVGRRGVRPAGVPLQRQRRPVHDDRRAARRPPAVGPGRRGQRRVARGRARSASTPSPRR